MDIHSFILKLIVYCIFDWSLDKSLAKVRISEEKNKKILSFLEQKYSSSMIITSLMAMCSEEAEHRSKETRLLFGEPFIMISI